MPAAATRSSTQNPLKISEVLTEENLAPTIILPIIDKLYEKRADYVAAMEKSGQSDAISKITSLIEEVTSGKN